ncbi:hypothetical protein X792_02460 [Dehalococcoides mccartyi CG1]|nr:hypothetical protein GY50_0434 [Dehalococcoides mccartyi GY50]AII58686.1 hypothetical protein X792_02460 [Dehalococcoides mccartyi CG1]
MLHYGEKQNGAVESPLGSHIIYKSHGLYDGFKILQNPSCVFWPVI